MKNTEIKIIDNEMSPFKFIAIITLMLLAGKLLGLADIDWIWVFSPIWGVVAVIILFVLVGIGDLIIAIIDRKK